MVVAVVESGEVSQSGLTQDIQEIEAALRALSSSPVRTARIHLHRVIHVK